MFTQTEPKPKLPEINSFSDLFSSYTFNKMINPLHVWTASYKDKDGDNPTMSVSRWAQIRLGSTYNGKRPRRCFYIRGLKKGILEKLKSITLFVDWDNMGFEIILHEKTASIYWYHNQIIGNTLLAEIPLDSIPKSILKEMTYE